MNKKIILLIVSVLVTVLGITISKSAKNRRLENI